MAEQCNVNTSSMSTYQLENQQLAEHFMENYFYKNFRLDKCERQQDILKYSIELIISPECNLGCKYCYVHKHRKEIFPASCFDREKTIVNLKKILKWMDVNEFNCDLEIFSGELFGQEIGYEVMEIIYEWLKARPAEKRIESVTIPTNFTWIMSDEHANKVEDLINRYEALGVHLGLSASFDGKYMEQNRPYLPKGTDIPFSGVRDDAYYDKCFAFAKRNHCGFHPMVYSKGIKDWPKNFDWFQEKLAEYGFPWEMLYLLQVRNEEWTAEDIKDLVTFMEYLYEFAWDKVGHDPKALVSWILETQGFNLLGECYSTCGRGLTCGIQTQFGIRVSDLAIYPCHRLGYKDLYQGFLVDDDEKVLTYKNINAELLIATYTVDKESLPYCAQCPINALCTGQCLGACYESNSNIFVPIPSVCAMHHAIALTGVRCLKKYGAFGIMLNKINETHKQQLLFLEEHYA